MKKIIVVLVIITSNLTFAFNTRVIQQPKIIFLENPAYDEGDVSPRKCPPGDPCIGTPGKNSDGD
jgi:hypothetical protein